MAQSNFVDYVKIHCRSGKGGSGSTHLRREKFVPRGGPDGGDGGRGGHVILRGDEQLWTLLPLRYTKHIRASHGEPGGKQTSTGADGQDAVIKVPLGTVVRDGDSMEIKGEITKHNQEIIVMRGGQGGQGNAHYKSPTNQTPRYAQPGGDLEEGWIVLELKLLADVGLVGFPNAGKSTLLSVVSAAKPEIANYPFTTLVPNLGIVAYRDHKSFIMADIPGIIEGASDGKGLGIRFLRHIERNSTLLFLVPVDAPDIVKEYEILLSELRKYNPELLDKNRLLALTKTDMLDDELLEEMKATIPKELDYVFISSVSNKGLQELKDRLWQKLHEE
jgi:GTP-binding protein